MLLFFLKERGNGKLLFIRLLELSLRDQSADWSWQSPNNSGRFVRAFVRFSYIPEYPGDCHVAALLAMTAFSQCAKQQFIVLSHKQPPHAFAVRRLRRYAYSVMGVQGISTVG